jgi:hypothetical protein
MRFRRTRAKLDRLDVAAWIGSGALIFLGWKLGKR